MDDYSSERAELSSALPTDIDVREVLDKPIKSCQQTSGPEDSFNVNVIFPRFV